VEILTVSVASSLQSLKLPKTRFRMILNRTCDEVEFRVSKFLFALDDVISAHSLIPLNFELSSPHHQNILIVICFICSKKTKIFLFDTELQGEIFTTSTCEKKT
jgi:hypothetical protein